MKIKNLNEIIVNIGFKLKFKHNTKERDQTESFFIKVSTDCGLIGHGEGCPRSYVTGETLESCREFLNENNSALKSIETIEDLNSFISKNDESISKNPSAFCAIEMAILDIIAKSNVSSVEQILNLKRPVDKKTITAVLGIDDKISFLKKLAKYRLYGLTDFKIKLSGNLQQDKQVLWMIKLSGIPKSRVRVDANNIWSSGNECISYLNEISNLFWGIEEPLKEKNISEFIRISNETGKKIILDESFLKIEDFEAIKDHPDVFLVNLRISKMGGVLRSLKIIELFREHSFQFILGSHVGETSLLSRVAISLAENYKKSIYAMEGAYSSHLLLVDPASPEIKFGKKGIVNVAELDFGELGWGMKFNE